MNQLRTRIGEVIARRRITKKLLAEQVGAPYSHVVGITTGRIRPGLELAIKIAAALDADVSWLFAEWDLLGRAGIDIPSYKPPVEARA